MVIQEKVILNWFIKGTYSNLNFTQVCIKTLSRWVKDFIFIKRKKKEKQEQ